MTNLAISELLMLTCIGTVIASVTYAVKLSIEAFYPARDLLAGPRSCEVNKSHGKKVRGRPKEAIAPFV